MTKTRPFTRALEQLNEVGLRPTRQRLALAKLLFEKGDCHLTAEHLHSMARDAEIKVSLATVYNTLHQFKDVGILREVVVEAGRSYFDTNTSKHHHFFNETTSELSDVPHGFLSVSNLPSVPAGTTLESVDVIVRVK